MNHPLETLRSQTTYTQDAMATALRIIEGAMQAGAGHARIQLLRQGYGHFHYVTTSEGTFTLPVHDAQTLAALEGGSRQRVQLSRPAHDIVHWARGQGLQVLCTTSAMQTGRLGGEPSLAPWLFVVAVFVPLGGEDGPLARLWNSTHMAKCLDASALDTWALRCERALQVGASHCALCVLYRGSDFTTTASADGDDAAYVAAAPRHHLTMQMLPGQCWTLDKRFKPLIGFARTHGYAWTLCMAADEQSWAYFTLLLDPMRQYEQLK